jgi:hypothetical protein
VNETVKTEMWPILTQEVYILLKLQTLTLGIYQPLAFYLQANRTCKLCRSPFLTSWLHAADIAIVLCKDNIKFLLILCLGDCSMLLIFSRNILTVPVQEWSMWTDSHNLPLCLCFIEFAHRTRNKNAAVTVIISKLFVSRN